MQKINLSNVEITLDGKMKIDYQNAEWHQKLAHLRKLNGLTQAEAAKICLTHHKNYWQWENGRIKPNVENQEVIAVAFDVSAEWLFS